MKLMQLKIDPDLEGKLQLNFSPMTQQRKNWRKGVVCDICEDRKGEYYRTNQNQIEKCAVGRRIIEFEEGEEMGKQFHLFS